MADEIYGLEKTYSYFLKNKKKFDVDTFVNHLKKSYGDHRITTSRVSSYIHNIKKDIKKVQNLRKLPKIQQRTMCWYEMRNRLITASDMAQALGHGKFGTVKDFIKKKCGYQEEKINFDSPPLKWGIMYEDVAAQIYSHRHNVEVYEFGLLTHPKIPFFGASPDGISDLGVMLEIKCPFKRNIDGTIPLQYYYQIQGQLDVCDLNCCGYLECKFTEFDTSN